jgi:hypothetical protein
VTVNIPGKKNPAKKAKSSDVNCEQQNTSSTIAETLDSSVAVDDSIFLNSQLQDEMIEYLTAMK